MGKALLFTDSKVFSVPLCLRGEVSWFVNGPSSSPEFLGRPPPAEIPLSQTESDGYHVRATASRVIIE
jgi:hypothetical protein